MFEYGRWARAPRTSTGIRDPRAVAIQFRYAFVTDADGLKVVDVTTQERPRLIESATVSMANAQGLYVARTYAYVAGGAEGLVIVDVERSEQPRIDQTFNAGGAINDSRDVKVAMTNASVFAYIADGVNGLQVVQLVSANDTPGAFGFSPRPAQRLIATRRTAGPALAISKGLDRDRAVDETGHQVALCSAAAAGVPSTARRCTVSTCVTARSGPSATIRRGP